MSLTGLLLTALALAVLAVVVVIFLAVVRHTPRARSADSLAAGDYEAAVGAAQDGGLEAGTSSAQASFGIGEGRGSRGSRQL